jgi:hypothetical protein
MGLKEAIEKTVTYASKYGVDLTWDEVQERLISKKIFKSLKSKAKFKKFNENKYWEEKMRIAEEFTDKYLSRIDDILMVGVTGSVASKYPKENDDIDLMVITKKDSLWITRLRVFWIFWKYKIPHRTNKNDICINLWLEDMTIPRVKRNLKNAVDLILMRPILDREETYSKFLILNKWVRKYIATAYDKKVN